MPSFIIAEVVDTSLAFEKNPKDDDGNKLAPGSVQVVFKGSPNKHGILNKPYVQPFDPNITKVPLLGEQVLITKAKSSIAYAGGASETYYYSAIVNINGQLNNNALPGQFDIATPGNNASSYGTSIGTPSVSKYMTPKLGETFKQKTVPDIQPYEGDLLFEGRFGQSIRFSSTVKGNTSIYNKKPSWSGRTSGDPITILSTGHDKPAGMDPFYIVEDIDKDDSSIYLTSKQKLDKFTTSQKKLGNGVTLGPKFDNPQVVITSDRIILNSKKDYIILSGKKSVNVATPKWQMDMDKLFTILEGFLQQFVDLSSAKSALPTPTGGLTLPSPALAQIQKLLKDLKAMSQK